MYFIQPACLANLSFCLFFIKSAAHDAFTTPAGTPVLLKDRGDFVDGQIGITFYVEACRDVFLYIMGHETDLVAFNYPIYHIIIGGWSNTRNELARRVDTYKTVYRHDSVELSCGAQRYFWVTWENGFIQVGRGSSVGSDVFLSYSDDCPFSIRNFQVESTVTVSWHVDKILPPTNLGTKEKKVVSKFTVANTCPTFEIIASMSMPSAHACGSLCLYTEDCFRFRYSKSSKTCEVASMTVSSTNVLSYFLVEV